ncbi:alpha/beta fold hydrolase [Pelagibius sp. Alg239-R121]|uniref:alpha/beta fold hydrolase n=1 Tax=Pelagibius sp. Alg239-R121 TaxID=2993448 RepID=UPI0024A6B3F8|nr:alpha/beta hydrolase [Pelagibius sp. Alg239-R121]
MTYRQILLAAAVALGSLATAPLVLATPQEKLMALNGTKLTYVEEGTGTPVVFVHGAISDMRAWDPYRPEIASERRFIAYTQRYFGTAAWSDKAEHFSRETHIDDLIAFIEGLDAGPVHLVTWSYSGGIGTYASLRRPDLFRSIIHYEPSARALLSGLPGSSAARTEMFKNFGPAITAMKAGKAEDAALRFIEAVFKLPEGNAATEPEPWPSYWRANGRTIPPFLAMAPGGPISCDQLGAMTVPTLIVQGKNTYTRYSMMAERLANCQANALLITLSGANHDGPYRKPREFTTLIKNFLALVE